jgi:peptidoglycan-N-acetylglucosamine deacetylase
MLAITVDVEDWYHVPSMTGSPFSKFTDTDDFFAGWTDRYDYLTEPTGRILDILKELEIKATFFIVADITEHYPGLVEKIVQKGHEIACHGLHHACKIDPKTKKPLITREEFETITRKAKQMLERISGQEVIGYRAPSAYIAGWMIDSLEKIGFKYDSSVSVNSFYNKSDSSLKMVQTMPYYPKNTSLEPGNKRGILEIPWPYLKVGLKFPAGGGPILRFLGARYVSMGLKQSVKRGDTLFYFHPIDISNDKFPSKFSVKRPFYWVIKGNLVENRIRQILTDTGFETGMCRDIVKKYI